MGRLLDNGAVIPLISTVIHWSPKHFQIRTGREEEGTEQKETTTLVLQVHRGEKKMREMYKQKQTISQTGSAKGKQ